MLLPLYAAVLPDADEDQWYPVMARVRSDGSVLMSDETRRLRPDDERSTSSTAVSSTPQTFLYSFQFLTLTRSLQAKNLPVPQTLPPQFQQIGSFG